MLGCGVIPAAAQWGFGFGIRSGAGRAHERSEDGQLLRRGLTADDAKRRRGLRLTHSGMFPCFFGGSVSRLFRSMRSDLIT